VGLAAAGSGAKGRALLRLGLIAHPNPGHHPGTSAGTDASDQARDDPLDTQCWSLLIRRHRDTGELAVDRCHGPQPVPLRELVRVAGRRWTVEESFQADKGMVSLNEHQVRRWTLLNNSADPRRSGAP
jgi:hypothetical protein